MAQRWSVRRPYWFTSVILLSAGVSLAGVAQTPASPSREPARIVVVADDYAFLQVPTALAAGETLFSFENQGRVRHEMSVALLKPGVTLDQVMQSGFPAAQRRAGRLALLGN